MNKLYTIGVDTNIFAYYLNRASQFYPLADKVFSKILTSNGSIHTSILTLTELLSFPVEKSILDNLESEFSQIPNIQMHAVTRQIALKAANIRRIYGFTVVDAAQLATAIAVKTEIFITNDKKLIRFKELPVRLLPSF